MTYAIDGVTISQYPVAAGGMVTRVLDAGHGETTVVCLHGAGSRADRFFHSLAPVAAAGYRVLAMDFPGHGYASKGTSVTHSTPAFATFVTAVLDELGVEQPVLVGTSLGGHVAATMVVADPSSVRAQVLIGAVGIAPAAGGEAPLTRVPMWDATPEGIRTKLKLVVAREALITDEWVNEESHINSSPGAEDSLRAVADYLANGVEGDLVGARLVDGGLAVPTLLVWGAEDRWVPPSVGRRVQELLGAPLVLMPGTAHAPYYEDPATFNRLLLDFLAGRPIAPAGPRGGDPAPEQEEHPRAPGELT